MLAVPVLVFFLIFAFLVMIFSSIVSGGGFTLGTYAAQDYDLSQAEKHYTQLAWNFNLNLLKVGSSSNWKKGLKAFGADTSGMKDKPDEWIYVNLNRSIMNLIMILTATNSGLSCVPITMISIPKTAI